MPANLPPQYFEAEKRFREAKSPESKIEALEEMLTIMPKHKGTDKLRADVRRKISKFKTQSKQKKGVSRRESEYSIDICARFYPYHVYVEWFHSLSLNKHRKVLADKAGNGFMMQITASRYLSYPKPAFFCLFQASNDFNQVFSNVFSHFRLTLRYIAPAGAFYISYYL